MRESLREREREREVEERERKIVDCGEKKEECEKYV
jgi:hypothetical protein